MRTARFLASVALVLAAGHIDLQAQAPRFYPDDPLRAEPAPLPVSDLQPRSLSEVLERVRNTFKATGQRHPPAGVIPAGGVNTLGEVLDGDWYVNRHATVRMTLDELTRGPGSANAPTTGSPWQVLVVKPFGLNPGVFDRGREEHALPAALRPDRVRRAGDRRRDGDVALSPRARLPRARELPRPVRAFPARSQRRRAGRIERGSHACPDRRRHRRVSPSRSTRAEWDLSRGRDAPAGGSSIAAWPISTVRNSKRRPQRHGPSRASSRSAGPVRVFGVAEPQRLPRGRHAGHPLLQPGTVPRSGTTSLTSPGRLAAVSTAGRSSRGKVTSPPFRRQARSGATSPPWASPLRRG